MKLKIFNPRLSASIQIKKGRNYQLVYRIDAGKPIWKSLGTADYKTAQIEAEKMIRQIESQVIGGIKLSEILDKWKRYNSKGKSDWYKIDVEKHYGKFIEFFQDSYAHTLTKDDLLKFRENNENRGLSNSSLAVRFRTIKAVWNWARDNEYIEKDIFHKFPIPRTNVRKEWLTLKQLEKVIKAANDNKLYQGYLNFLIVTGFRIGELYRLKWVNIFETHIFLEKTKKGETELIQMRPNFKEILEQIWDNQEKHGNYVFSNKYGERLSYYTLHSIIKKYLIKAGFNDYVPHHLRHSFGSNLVVEKKTDIYRIKELMRHKDVQTTQRYAKITGKDISDEEANIFHEKKPLFVKGDGLDKFFEIEEVKVNNNKKGRWNKT